MASAYPSRASECACACRASPTTPRSAWNCAKEVSRTSRARGRPTWETRFTAMLYVGRKLERSGYRRLDAKPASATKSSAGWSTTTAWPSTSMPRRPARPVSWVYSPGVISTCRDPSHLTSLSSTTERAGMLMPSARVSVAKTTRTRPRAKRSSTVSLNSGSIPAWWAAIPRESASRNPQYPRTPRSSGGIEAQRSSTTRRISASCSWSVNRRPAATHCATAPSHPAREKMNAMAGSRPASSSRSTTMNRGVGRLLPWPPPCARTPCPRPRYPRSPGPRRPCCAAPSSRSRRTTRASSGLIGGLTPGSVGSTWPAYRSCSAPRASTCWPRGTGRCSLTTTAVSPRTAVSHSPNSSALDTVAESDTSCTSSGRWRITSSHTGPRNRSAR